MEFRESLRLSHTGDLFGYPNPKWISNTIPIDSNRVSIQKTYFGYQERHNPNLGILSPRDPFAESVVF
jgi:hypothetical protein